MPDPRLPPLADALVPGAAEADHTGKWTDRALAARPDLRRAFERALGAVDVNRRPVGAHAPFGLPHRQPPTATIAANAHRCVGHLIEAASLQAVPA
jgi:hypothetical protein